MKSLEFDIFDPNSGAKRVKRRRAKKCQNPLRPNCSNPAFVYVVYKGRMIIPVCQRCEKELMELNLDRFNALRLRPLLLRDAEKVVEEANRKFGTHFTIIGGLAERGFTFNDIDVAGEDKYVLPKEINAAIYISQKLKIHVDIIPRSLGGIWHVNWHTRRICRHEFDFDPLECKPYWCNLFHRPVSLFDCDACPKGDGPCPFWTERVVRREGAIKNGKSTQDVEAGSMPSRFKKEKKGGEVLSRPQGSANKFERGEENMEEAKLKALKQIFPELKNLEGRFLHLFLRDLQEKIEDWAIWARLELQGKKCYNTYRDAICKNCAHFSAGGCTKYPKLGQIWEGAERADLRHPNTEEWYWCIKECPNFIEKKMESNDCNEPKVS